MNYKYEVILLGDDSALQFALEYRDKLFQEIPTVFFGANDMELAKKAAALPNFTGFFENSYLDQTVELATKLFPKRKTLVALHDESINGNLDIKIFWSLRNKYSDYSFIDLNSSKLTQENLVLLLNSLPKDSILFYMTCYTDKNNKIYSMLSRTNTIVKYAEVPIFRNYNGGIGSGVLGDVCMDFENQCENVGKTVLSILYGNDISKIPLNTSTPSKTTFDWSLMKKYNLNFSILPEETVFVNAPESFIEHYGKILPLATLFTLTFLMIIATSFFATAYSKSMTEELKKSHQALRKSQGEFRYHAQYDEVLDILNRRTITEWFHNTMTPKDVYSVVLIDIDGFKSLNENYGHSIADSILQYLVALIKNLASKGGWKIARFGGDEFLIIISDETLTIDCETSQSIMALIRAPIPLGDESIAITASIGVSNSDGVTEPDQHILNAESAMVEAKAHGKNGIFVYSDEMKEKVRQEQIIKEKLQQAFDNDGFYMLYQPQINSKTKNVSGYEALVRMKEPGIYPGQFIPVAEKSGWIWRIGRITTELVIKQLAAWLKDGKEVHPVSVNYSSNQLNDHGYIDFLADLLNKYQVPPNLIEIEITEGVFLEKSALADEIFKRFKKLGIRLLMDDFGTGYSSLGYLTYIPVDVIKLDKSLVDAYLVDGKESFIKNIITLIHDLDKEMIIEGVEEEWQFNRLREFNADTIQGYFFSKPISADDAIVFKV